MDSQNSHPSWWTSEALHNMTIGAIEDVKERVINLTDKVDKLSDAISELKGEARVRAATVATLVSVGLFVAEALVRHIWG